jgi:23S rRNA (cytosine1962-C5)-methyltransferase
MPEPSSGPDRRRHGRPVHDDPVTDRTDHELLDLGDGRQLERFGTVVLDRPCPAAAWHTVRDPAAWVAADARFDRQGDGVGAWTTIGEALAPWQVELVGLAFELRLTDSGQVGVFPEQIPTWQWLRNRATSADRTASDRPPEVLNLFAYTGGSTLAAAAGGARVVHVDAARSAVAWARRNAELGSLGEAPIRWIADDALDFVRRERRRGRRYDGVVLDPPSYGHGAGGRAWHLEADLPELLEACVALLAPGPAFLVLSVHTPKFGPDRLADQLRLAVGPDGGGSLEVDDLRIEAVDGRRVTLGAVARWSR